MFKLHLFTPADVQKTSTSTTNNDLQYEIKEYYEKQLLRNAEPNLVHDQFGTKYTVPQGHGHTIEWRKFTALAKAMTPLTEAVTPDGSVLDVTHVTSTLYQYGDFIRTSDRLELEAIDPIINETSKLQGSQAGLTLNSVTRDELATATNKMFSGGVSARTSLTASTNISVQDVFDAVAKLRAANVPTIGGDYVCIIHPWIANDLMTAVSSSGSHVWMDVHKYAAPENIFNGEIGKLGGCRFVSSTEAKIWNDSTCPSASSPLTGYLSVFQTLFLGEGAYAVTDLSGAGLEYIVKPLGYGEDPLNQRASMGWKAMKAAKILDNTRIVSLESVSKSAPQASAN